MKNKKFRLICLVFAIVGICLATIGFLTGGNTQSYIDLNGIHFEKFETQTISNNPIGEFYDIEIDVSSAKVSVLRGDDYKIEIENTAVPAISYKLEGKKLVVSQGKDFIWYLFFGGFTSNSVNIYVPEDAQINTVTSDMSAGSINVNDITCDYFYSNLTSGSVHINNVAATEFKSEMTSGSLTVDGLESDNMDVSLTSGKVEAKNVTTRELFNFDMTSGYMSLEGKLNGKIKSNITSGSADLFLQGNAADYSRVINVTSGSVKVNGLKQEGSFISPSAKNSVEIDMTSGSFNIQFE
ncbi:MAG: DUF4097 domain-containing protein [Oscillospiraceae bacterium]|jgi:lia operon protein LiaG|nr:DUF4097 domain-containing protein [Oscillospiraceae bacterium]